MPVEIFAFNKFLLRLTKIFSAVVGALLDTLDDKNQDVKRSVIESIERISKKNPETVIHAAIYFWEMHKKVDIQCNLDCCRVLQRDC